MDYQFMILATDMVPGMPGGSDTGKGSQAGGGAGRWKDGYELKKGDWEPEGLRVLVFEDDTKMDSWYKSAEGVDFAKRYQTILMFRIHD